MSLQSISDVVTWVAEVHRVPRRSILASTALLCSIVVAMVAVLGWIR